MSGGFAATTGGAVLIAFIVIATILCVPCAWYRYSRRRRENREQERKKLRQLRDGIELPQLERGDRPNLPQDIPHPAPPPPAVTTVRAPELDPSGATMIPAYTPTDSEPLSQREQELVAQMNVMADRIRGLEAGSRGEDSQQRPPEYRSAETGVVNRDGGTSGGPEETGEGREERQRNIPQQSEGEVEGTVTSTNTSTPHGQNA